MENEFPAFLFDMVSKRGGAATPFQNLVEREKGAGAQERPTHRPGRCSARPGCEWQRRGGGGAPRAPPRCAAKCGRRCAAGAAAATAAGRPPHGELGPGRTPEVGVRGEVQGGGGQNKTDGPSRSPLRAQFHVVAAKDRQLQQVGNGHPQLRRKQRSHPQNCGKKNV